MSRRRWIVALPLATCTAASAVFLLAMVPPGSAEIDSSRRPAALATQSADQSPTRAPTQASYQSSEQSPAQADRTSGQTSATVSPSSSATGHVVAPTRTGQVKKPATPSRPRTAATSKPPRAQAAPPVARLPIGGPGIQAAADYATARGYRVGVAVLDTRTGTMWGAGEHASLFASESVVKVFIATRLLLGGQLTGDTADTAFRMISRSDDGSANALYGYAGGDQVLPWIASHYGIANLGTPPTQAGWWSNTHVSAAGLVQFYAKVKADPVVWPWLSKAMHAATEYGSDGTYQFFGLKQADPAAAIKQGWGQDDDDWSASSDFNSTGFVNDDRYAVAILLKGPSYEYRSGVPAMVSSVARKLMPHGVVRP